LFGCICFHFLIVARLLRRWQDALKNALHILTSGRL
jgi:hypothetical protein